MRHFLLKGIGACFISIAIVWNIFILIDAIGFELGEHLTPLCRGFRASIGFSFEIAAFLVQLVTFSILIWKVRSWLLGCLSVFPFWVVFASKICTGLS